MFRRDPRGCCFIGLSMEARGCSERIDDSALCALIACILDVIMKVLTNAPVVISTTNQNKSCVIEQPLASDALFTALLARSGGL
jgi:hypothetical protein